jgi:hypothetical protein
MEAKPRVRSVPEQREPWFAALASREADMVVFLDFDGVLHPLGPDARRFSQASKLLGALEKLDRAGVRATIVLSTSWRFQPMATILSELDKAAPGLASRVEGRCGSAADSGAKSPRLQEALEYLEKRPGGRPASFAALDDKPSLFARDGAVPEWVVACDSTRGFVDDSALELTLRALLAARRSGAARGRGPDASP